MKRVLVTGANGFVGRRTCLRLMEEGWSVRGAVRRAEAAATLPPGVEPLCTGAMQDFPQWQRALLDVDAVVHLAARTHVMREQASDPLAEYRRTNVQGMQRILEALPNSRVRRFLFLSSIKAVGEGADHPYTETETCDPQDAYGISKLEAEQLLWSASRSATWDPVMLRVPLVYGPGVSGNFRRLMQAVQRGWPLPFRRVHNQRDLVFVDNVVDAILTCLTRRQAVHQVYHVTDGLPVSTSELIRLMGLAIGQPARLFPVPVWIVKALATACGKQAEAGRLIGSLTVDSTAIRQQLDWRPPFSLSEGLKLTMRASVGDADITTAQRRAA